MKVSSPHSELTLTYPNSNKAALNISYIITIFDLIIAGDTMQNVKFRVVFYYS